MASEASDSETDTVSHTTTFSQVTSFSENKPLLARVIVRTPREAGGATKKECDRFIVSRRRVRGENKNGAVLCTRGRKGRAFLA